MLSLIQEYAGKLRALCEGYVEERSRRQQILLLTLLTMTAMVVTFAAGLSSFTRLKINPDVLSIVVGVMVTFVGAVVLTLFRSSAVRSSRSYDTHQVASTVERLLRTASQYSEHASHTLGDKFEFDIRLAEAEAALRMYKDVFREPDSLKAKLFSDFVARP